MMRMATASVAGLFERREGGGCDYEFIGWFVGGGKTVRLATFVSF